MWWWLAAALAQDACTYVGMSDITSVSAPAVIVLGERHGFQPDLGRASRVAHALQRRGPVTVALEAVHARFQPILDDFARGRMEPSDLPELMSWEDSWGFPYAPYQPLVTGSRAGMKVVAAGLDLGPRPDDQPVPLPPRYMEILRPAMGDHTIPPESEGRFVQAMAWRDYRIAEIALSAWSGQGYLVIVTGRGHVEGGKGVAWQAQRMTQVPVQGYVLKAGPDAPCWPGDQLWR